MRRLALLILPALLALPLATAAPAGAAFGLKDLAVTFEEEDGSLDTTPGTHPFAMTTNFAVQTEVVPGGAEDQVSGQPVDGEVPEEELKDLTVAQMPGLIGAQTAVPYCSAEQFATRFEGYASCPDQTAVGIAAVKAEFKTFPLDTEAFLHLPIYNLAPPPGVAAEFGFVTANVPITFDVLLNEAAPHNLVVRLPDSPQALLVYGARITLWGTPGAAAHDGLRGQCVGSPVEPTAEPISNGSCPVQTEGEPLLTLPRSCQGPLTTLFEAGSWQGGFDAGDATTAQIEGCGALPFAAQTQARPTASSASFPSGLDFSIDVQDPGLTDPKSSAQADVAAVRTTLPEGVSANPSAAEGQGTCSRVQFQAASLGSLGCPGDSKIAGAEALSPLLAEPLQGSVYLAAPRENPFGSLLAAYLVIRNPRYGIFVKQAGEITADPADGRLTATFEEIPELPFSHLRVHFREGPRALLATPQSCGTYATTTELTPSSGNEPISSGSSFQVTSGPDGAPCPTRAPFAPGFLAGTLTNTAGTYSPFYMRFTRRDGEAQISGLGALLPPGVLGKIAGLGRCSDAAIDAARTKSGRAELAQPSCPPGAQIGRLLVGAGVGPVLTHVPGSLYLAGPYKGHPLSIVSIVPAVAGPFDLGTVVVRSALDLDPTTAQVEVIAAASDPIPTILEGIPVALRDIQISVDRPDFTLNPTSCKEESARATLLSGSLTAPLAQRFQATGCGRLAFRPKLKLGLKGSTQRGKDPALQAVLTQPPGEANIARVAVTLPKSEFIDNRHIDDPCTRVQFDAGAGNGSQCPAKSILGYAKAYTPLLDRPLRGPVYFRSNGGERKLPDLVASLDGQVHLNLVGFIDSVHHKGSEVSRTRSTFAMVPDAPVSRFVLSLKGGRKGLLQNSADLCKVKNLATVKMVGQNGAHHNLRPSIAKRCSKRTHHKRQRHHAGKHARQKAKK